jgi:hypothetical protein
VTLIRGGKWVWWGGIAALLAVSAWNHLRARQADPFTAIAVVQWSSLQNWRTPVRRCAFGIGLCGGAE